MGGTGYTRLLKQKRWVEEQLFSSSDEEEEGNGSGGDDPAPASSAGTSSHGGGGGGGGGAAPAAAPRLLLSTSPAPLQRPGAPRRAADDDEDMDGGLDNGNDFRDEASDKETLSALAREHSSRNIQKKIEILSQRYTHVRRTRGYSSCFYRAFLFSYLENLGQLEDRQGEVTRLMQHVATSKESFCGLIWDRTNFSNHFTSLQAEFNTMVDSIANGLSSHERFESCLQAMRSLRSSRIIFLLRLLAEVDIRTRGEEYRILHPQNFSAIPYCRNEVRPMDAQASPLAIRALTYALGIPLRVEIVDGGLTDGIAKVKRIDFFPRGEPDKVSYHAVPSYWRSILDPTPEEMGSCDLLSDDKTPLLTLLCVRKPLRWYILYRERMNHASVP